MMHAWLMAPLHGNLTEAALRTEVMSTAVGGRSSLWSCASSSCSWAASSAASCSAARSSFQPRTCTRRRSRTGSTGGVQDVPWDGCYNAYPAAWKDAAVLLLRLLIPASQHDQGMHAQGRERAHGVHDALHLPRLHDGAHDAAGVPEHCRCRVLASPRSSIRSRMLT